MTETPGAETPPLDTADSDPVLSDGVFDDAPTDVFPAVVVPEGRPAPAHELARHLRRGLVSSGAWSRQLVVLVALSTGRGLVASGRWAERVGRASWRGGIALAHWGIQTSLRLAFATRRAATHAVKAGSRVFTVAFWRRVRDALSDIVHGVPFAQVASSSGPAPAVLVRYSLVTLAYVALLAPVVLSAVALVTLAIRQWQVSLPLLVTAVLAATFLGDVRAETREPAEGWTV